MQTDNIEYEVQLARLKSVVNGHYKRIAKLSNYSKATVSEVLTGKLTEGESVDAVLTAAKQVRDEINKKKESRTKLIS